jgi:hypothetical protein
LPPRRADNRCCDATGGGELLRGLTYWRAHGSPWRVARPVAELAKLLRGYGYGVGTLGNEEHLRHVPPEDHTPFAATGWPRSAAYGVVYAGDVMAPGRRGVPTLAQLGAQLYADRNAGHPGVRWVKYMNWTPTGGPCVHDSWMPDHARRPSQDKGHIHVSARTDCADVALGGYDPVAAVLRKPHPVPVPADDDVTRRIVMGLPQLKAGANGPPVRRLQALMNVAGGHVAVDGDFGAGTGAELRRLQARLKVTPDGVAGPRTWAALLGVSV